MAAANQLGGLGLVTTEQSEANDTVAAGTVIRTDPPAGTQVDKGSTVVLVVSSGATPVQVPNVVGATESAARDALQNANLKSQVVNVDVPFGSPQANVVIDQTPGAGEQVAPGSTVTIRIGKPGPPTTTAPPTTASGTSTTTGPDGPGVGASARQRGAEEVGQQVVAADRQDRLGVELHALDRQVPVAQAHDRAVGGLGRDSKQSGRPSRSTTSEW